MKVVKSEMLDNWESKQFMFPKSKKKRIRKKWSKRGSNFKNVFAQNYNALFHKGTNTMFMSSALYEKYKEKAEKEGSMSLGFFKNIKTALI
jgi:hypothetical protein